MLKCRIITVAIMTIGVIIGAGIVAGPSLVRSLLDTTEYSPGYTESAFDAVQVGMTEAEVIRLLGEPLGKHEATPGVVRWYGPPGAWVDDEGGLHEPSSNQISKSGIFQFDLDGRFTSSGKSAEAIRAEYGDPIKEQIRRAVIIWRYSWSPPDGNYHRRWISFDPQGQVSEKKAYYYWD